MLAAFALCPYSECGREARNSNAVSLRGEGALGKLPPFKIDSAWQQRIKILPLRANANIASRALYVSFRRASFVGVVLIRAVDTASDLRRGRGTKERPTGDSGQGWEMLGVSR